MTFITFLISFELLINVQNLGTISYWLGGWKPPWGIEYVLDYLNTYILLISEKEPSPVLILDIERLFVEVLPCLVIGYIFGQIKQNISSSFSPYLINY